LPEHEPDHDRENDDCNAFLHDFELRESKAIRADPIGGHLKKIFKESEKPARNDRSKAVDL
jgi:hypothetical protein